MTEIEILEVKIDNLCLEYWNLLPEPKRPYTAWWYGINGIEEALRNCQLGNEDIVKEGK